MKQLQYTMMGIAFTVSLISIIMWYGHGFHTWAWQLACISWIIDSFVKQRRIDQLENKQ